MNSYRSEYLHADDVADTRKCIAPSFSETETVTLSYPAPGYGAIRCESSASNISWSAGGVPAHTTSYERVFCPVSVTQPEPMISAAEIAIMISIDIFFIVSPRKEKGASQRLTPYLRSLLCTQTVRHSAGVCQVPSLRLRHPQCSVRCNWCDLHHTFRCWQSPMAGCSRCRRG